MADTETAVPVLLEIIENAGGTSDAKTVVEALNDLKDLLGEGGITEAVYAWLADHSVETGYSVDASGDLSVTLT